MGAKEGAMILDVINRLRAKGEVSIVIIAHNYAHIFDVCDRINLLRTAIIVFDKSRGRHLGPGAHRYRGQRVSPRRRNA